MDRYYVRRCLYDYEVLGFFYDLDKTNIEDNLKDVLATLDTLTTFIFERPLAERTRLNSLQA
jgi:hypothetical protein